MNNLNVIIQPRWLEIGKIITFSVMSKGLTGKDWIQKFLDGGVHMTPQAKCLIQSPLFKPTSNVESMIALLRGSVIKGEDHSIRNFIKEGEDQGFEKCTLEIACLVREYFGDSELDQIGMHNILVMHDLVPGHNCEPSLLFLSQYQWFHAISASRKIFPGDSIGLAFVVSQNNN